ncbi:MAG: ABC transporter substrate-binding protein [Actinomycetota bacterium]
MRRVMDTSQAARVLVVLVAIAVLGAACSDDDTDAATPSEATAPTTIEGSVDTEVPETTAPSAVETTTSADVGPFPVTLPQFNGEVTISTEPQAVFTLDEWTLDLVTSLGVQPIGATTFSPPMEYLTGPLVDATDITVLAGELPVEAIAAASPDLIVEAWGFQSLQLELEPTLNEIAPTVTPVSELAGDEWRVALRHVAAALGRSDEAEALIGETEETVADVRAAHPELDGAAVTLMRWNPESGDSAYALVAGDDPIRLALSENFGFVSPEPQLEALANGEADEFGTLSYSIERFDFAGQGADVVIMSVTGGDPTPVLENPLWAAQEFVTEGRVVYISEDTIFALAAPSPRAISYVIDTVIPPTVEILGR